MEKSQVVSCAWGQWDMFMDGVLPQSSMGRNYGIFIIGASESTKVINS